MSDPARVPSSPDSEPVLACSDLEIDYAGRTGRVRALDGATLTVRPGEVMALVGESGSGKSTLALAAGRLLDSSAKYSGGSLTVCGTPVLECEPRALRALRRNLLGFVFQNPISALDPTMRVGRQLELADVDHSDTPPVETLAEVGLQDDLDRVWRSYPHQLSGGMAQRVAIAMVLRRQPKLIVADEPTSALDASRRGQILDLLVSSCRSRGCALLLLTHDIQSVVGRCSHIAVMYGGRVVETGLVSETLDDPLHPYTRALVGALPGDEPPGVRLEAIPGGPPVLDGPCPGCAFAPRCVEALAKCTTTRPALRNGRRSVCCHLYPNSGDAASSLRSAGEGMAESQSRSHNPHPSASLPSAVSCTASTDGPAQGRGA
jgi:peptide/nickel transport system ATP-binding protein